ncbi:hypothetical protein V1502_09800 [Bacillus sp. SCS-153A]|uniref:hypothetical protein n=1 Tax=Rossellomorea sedimentorum TaxID=3115294 RepID=UPI003905BE0C
MQISDQERDSLQSINDIHDEALVNLFRVNIGRRVFMLLPNYPFIFIGKIEEVMDDMVLLQVETSQFPALEGVKWHIHIHNIEVFYIEKSTGPRIPRLRD